MIRHLSKLYQILRTGHVKIVHEIIEEYKNTDKNQNLNNENENSPPFLFTDRATNEELYAYLKENPSASRFIFKKYTANQSFLKELCDPENPIHLEEVAKNLQNVYKLQDDEQRAREIEDKISRLDHESEKLKEEIKEYETEYDTINGNLDAIKKED